MDGQTSVQTTDVGDTLWTPWQDVILIHFAVCSCLPNMMVMECITRKSADFSASRCAFQTTGSKGYSSFRHSVDMPPVEGLSFLLMCACGDALFPTVTLCKVGVGWMG